MNGQVVIVPSQAEDLTYCGPVDLFPLIRLMRGPRWLHSMKKTFPLKAPGKDDARVRDKIRHEIRKYVRRERKKPLPEGCEVWNIECKVGPSATNAEPMPLKQVGGAIDQVAGTGVAEVYVEIVAVAAPRNVGRPL